MFNAPIGQNDIDRDDIDRDAIDRIDPDDPWGFAVDSIAPHGGGVEEAHGDPWTSPGLYDRPADPVDAETAAWIRRP